MSNEEFQKLVLEELLSIKKKLTTVDDKLTGVEDKLTNVDERLTNVEGKLANVDERLTNIENKLVNVDERLTGVEERLINVEEKLLVLEEGQNEMRKDLKTVFEQTADLAEFKTETKHALSDIKDTLHFLLHKEIETEKEIFKLKEKASLIK